jgi:hypothetical protein
MTDYRWGCKPQLISAVLYAARVSSAVSLSLSAVYLRLAINH